MTPSYSVEYGPGALLRLPAHVARLRRQRILLVTGKASFDRSGASRITPLLQEIGDVRRWSDFSPNTDAADLWEGLQYNADFGADIVIGIGGGSVMDMAKLMSVYSDAGTLNDLLEAIRGGGRVEHRSSALMLAPTTSGSGSEATHFAVVYINSHKFSVAGRGLHADVVALDPDLAGSGSSHQRATSGMDAVCQAVESRWAADGTRRSRRYAEFALMLLLASIEDFVLRADARSASAMQLGSHLAGRAIDISKTTAAHALSYGITKRYNVDHGSAAALTLGHFIQAHHGVAVDRLQPRITLDEHEAALRFIVRAFDASDGSGACTSFRDLLTRLGLPSTLTDVGHRSTAELHELALSVNVQRLGNNPVIFTTDDLHELLARAVD